MRRADRELHSNSGFHIALLAVLRSIRDRTAPANVCPLQNGHIPGRMGTPQDLNWPPEDLNRHPPWEPSMDE